MEATSNTAPSVRGCLVIRLPVLVDDVGTLSVAELGRHLPFAIKRYFLLFDIQPGTERGDHAHRALHQFIVCVWGSCTLVLDDGTSRDSIVLKSRDVGVHVPPMTWVIVHPTSADAVVLALVSDLYDAADYIRDYAEFRQLVGAP